tara:strand:+ start:606 stop:1700 length:1095 start_codon:yes stop_codon:yes gene_type:complete
MRLPLVIFFLICYVVPLFFYFLFPYSQFGFGFEVNKLFRDSYFYVIDIKNDIWSNLIVIIFMITLLTLTFHFSFKFYKLDNKNFERKTSNIFLFSGLIFVIFLFLREGFFFNVGFALFPIYIFLISKSYPKLTLICLIFFLITTLSELALTQRGAILYPLSLIIVVYWNRIDNLSKYILGPSLLTLFITISSSLKYRLNISELGFIFEYFVMRINRFSNWVYFDHLGITQYPKINYAEKNYVLAPYSSDLSTELQEMYRDVSVDWYGSNVFYSDSTASSLSPLLEIYSSSNITIIFFYLLLFSVLSIFFKVSNLLQIRYIYFIILYPLFTIDNLLDFSNFYFKELILIIVFLKFYSFQSYKISL